MSIEKLTTETDSLNWRKDRIEILTRDLFLKRQESENMTKLFLNEVEFVQLLRNCIKDIADIYDKDSKESIRLIASIDNHIKSQEEFIKKNNLKK